MSINSNHVTGFVVGLGTAALGFYLYKKNQAIEVLEFLPDLPFAGFPHPAFGHR